MRDIRQLQLRSFDQRIADFRKWYDLFEPEDRPKVRAWLDLAIAFERADVDWESMIYIQLQNDEVDENGNVVRWADVTFTPTTMLEAITAWDACEEYAPPSIMP